MFHQRKIFSAALLGFPTLMILAFIGNIAAQQIAPVVGIRNNTPAVHAFTNARIVVAPGKVIENGTLVIRDGLVVAVGAKISIPPDARLWDLTGLTIYPGLIDACSDLGMPKKAQGGDRPPFGGDAASQPKQTETRGPKHWNENVLASQNAVDMFAPDPKAAEKLRAMGFTTAHVVPQKGIFRGTTAVYDLGDGTANQLLVNPFVGQYVTFETSQGNAYPNSLMGAVALIRQTLYDARWHRDVFAAIAKYPSEAHPDYVEDLAALAGVINGKQPVIFETTDELSLLRAAAVANEFSLKFWIRGSGTEYRRIDAVKKIGAPVILPVNFPDAPAVATPEEALDVSLQTLKYWDAAPENPKRLADAGISFAFTTAVLKDPSAFAGNIRKAIERGLSRDAALAALTTTPASLLGIAGKTGTLEPAKLANFLITDGDLFGEKTNVFDTWIDGKRYEVKQRPLFDVRGTWSAHFSGTAVDSFTLLLKGEADKPSGTLSVKGKEIKLSTVTVTDLRLALSFTGDSAGLKGLIRMTGIAEDGMITGAGELADGTSFTWNASRTAPFKPEPDTAKPKPPRRALFPVTYPDGEFGRPALPERPENILVHNATIWTSGSQGTISGADMLISKGKIVHVGKDLSAPSDALVIDGTGKHCTAGLIDCHSHSAVTGNVNETGKTITSEVRIGDVIDADDIAIYRELAGGLTAANVLHGSANPIGGQNQVIKLRWGMLPEEMKFEGAMPGIKFALGENPKQSNWQHTTRYPESREGVEQIIRDEFRGALDYERGWNDFKNGKIHIPPRRDLQAEALLEVLQGKRLVHAHSYRQDEILMLMRVADDFGFKLGTLQHILEGYKVADQIAAHGVGASSFSDWWAYKFEVYDAIPYNGAMMHDEGVVVSYNSDDDELATRLNTEAAKAVKYGGVSPEEALKFVTLNPAKQLHIDSRVGSLEPGKDADFVLWSGDPLSAYSVAEQTWIDGRKFFDRDEDRKMSEESRQERAAIIQKILAAPGPEGGGKGFGPPPPPRSEKIRYSCHVEDSGMEGR